MLSGQSSTAGLVMIVLGGMFVLAGAVLLAIWHFAWDSRPPGLWLPTAMIFGCGIYLVAFGWGMRKGLLKKRQPPL